jgi:hypothetical protein
MFLMDWARKSQAVLHNDIPDIKFNRKGFGQEMEMRIQ